MFKKLGQFHAQQALQGDREKVTLCSTDFGLVACN